MKFLNFFKKSVLFSTDCRLFTFAVSVFVMFCSAIFTYILYFSHIQENHEKLILAANNVDVVLEESLKEIGNLMLYIGKEISDHDKEDISFIENILSNNFDILSRKKGVISCPQFSWANSKHFIVVGGNKPIDISHRPYTSVCEMHPWTLHASRPVVGITSGLWTIPVAFGVTNSKGNYLGSLITGLEVFKMSQRIQQALNVSNISFLVLDKDLKIVVQSLDNSIDPKSSYYYDLLKTFDIFNLRKSILEDPIKYKNIEYSFYKKMTDYPYVILTGFDKSFVSRNFLIQAGFQLLEVWGIGIFCLALLYFFRKRMLNIAYICEKDRDLFFKQIQQETQKPIMNILKHSSVLLEYFKERAKGDSHYEQIKLIGYIAESASNLRSLTTISNLNLGIFDVNQTIKECLNIYRNTAFVKEISIQTEFTQSLPSLYADELRFKQMVLGLIALAIDTYTPQGGVIKICTQLEAIEGKNYLILILEDNGLGFDIDDIERLRNRLNANNAHFIGMDLSSIKKLVLMHEGTFRLDATLPHGKKFTITLPYRENEFIKPEKQEIEPTRPHYEPPENLGTNVILFPGSN